MEIPSPEMVRRIESAVSSVPGVRRSAVVQEDGGRIRAVRVAVSPGHSPSHVKQEIRDMLQRSFDLELDPALLEVEVEEQLGRRQTEFWRGIDRRSRTGGEREPPPSPASSREGQEPASTGSRPEREPWPPTGPSPLPGPARRAGQSERGSNPALPLVFDGYAIHGGRDGRGELRVRVESDGEGFDAVFGIASLETVTPGTFVGATLRAVEQALDAHPIRDRSSRILILEALDVEIAELRRGRFLATTVRAVQREGEVRATGLAFEGRGGLRHAAARAALDAVTRILEDRDVERHSRNRSLGADPWQRREERDPFYVWDGEADFHGGEGRRREGPGERGG